VGVLGRGMGEVNVLLAQRSFTHGSADESRNDEIHCVICSGWHQCLRCSLDDKSVSGLQKPISNIPKVSLQGSDLE